MVRWHILDAVHGQMAYTGTDSEHGQMAYSIGTVPTLSMVRWLILDSEHSQMA